MAELDGANNVVSVFVYGTRANVPDYMLRGGNSYRIVSDQLGSVRLVVEASTGTIAQRIDYDEFGNATVVTDQACALAKTCPLFQPFAFAGGLFDADTGLVRFGARDYDAQTGRWVSKDPTLLAGGTNPYAYAAGDPVNFVDSNGAHPVPAVWLTGPLPQWAQSMYDAASSYFSQSSNSLASGDYPGALSNAALGFGAGVLGAIFNLGPYAPIFMGLDECPNGNSPIDPAAATQIQNAADRTGQTITLIGSQAAGTAGLDSDWDYILSGNSAQRHSAASSLPQGTSGGEVYRPGIDIFQDYNPNAPGYNPLDPTRPHIIFYPR